MANKPPKPKDREENSFTKAGRNSPSGGTNRRKNSGRRGKMPERITGDSVAGVLHARGRDTKVVSDRIAATAKMAAAAKRH